jgi:hypothetical protein
VTVTTINTDPRYWRDVAYAIMRARDLDQPNRDDALKLAVGIQLALEGKPNALNLALAARRQ